MKQAIYLLLIIYLVSCGTKQNSEIEKGKSRAERIHELSYRILDLDADLEISVKQDISRLLKRIETLDSIKLFCISRTGEFNEIDNSSFNTGQDAIEAANELWRTMDISSTLVTYPSFSQNATTGETKEVYVIEVENEKLTGTCRMFFNNPRPSELNKLTYTARN